jgi:hypothetical protein
VRGWLGDRVDRDAQTVSRSRQVPSQFVLEFV